VWEIISQRQTHRILHGHCLALRPSHPKGVIAERAACGRSFSRAARDIRGRRMMHNVEGAPPGTRGGFRTEQACGLRESSDHQFDTAHERQAGGHHQPVTSIQRKLQTLAASSPCAAGLNNP
jgi:hypothetical protein